MADVLRPELIWIEGRCYRKTEIVYPQADVELPDENFDHSVEPEYEPAIEVECPDEKTNKHFPYAIKKCGNGYVCQAPIPSSFHAYLIGKKGETKRRIMYEHHCSNIEFPKRGTEGNVSVEGSTMEHVRGCVEALLLLVDFARKKQMPTHFISIPLNQPAIVKSFAQFKEQILSQDKSRGISENVFQIASRFHLTLGMLVLSNDHERKQAQHVLHNALQQFKDILPEGGLSLRVKGLEYMNDDPAEVNVLYAKVLASGDEEADTCLLSLCNSVIKSFEDAGYLVRKHVGSLKLHATLLNSNFGKETEANNKDAGNTFDIRKIMSEFGDYNLGDTKCDAVHVSQRYAYDNNGYYKSTALIQL